MSRKMEVCAFGMSVLMSLSAFAKDATDGLVGWWRVEKGENGAVLKASDLRDHAHAGTTASAVNHATEDGTYKAYPICHTNLDLRYPTGCGVIENASCFHFRQPTNYNSSGAAVVNRQGIVFPADKIDIADKPCTFIIRMKFGGTRIAPKGFVPIFSYGWSGSGEGTGWNFGLFSDGSVNWSWMGACIGSKEVQAKLGQTRSLPVKDDPNWYDVGLVIEPNIPKAGQTRLVFYRTITNALENADMNAKLMAVETQVVEKVAASLDPEKRLICIGDVGGSDNWVSVNNNAASFKGLIHEMKLYDRALSVKEFEQACAPYTDPLFTVGSKNGSADEFSDETAESIYEPFVMPWCKLRKTLTLSNPSISIKTSVTEADKDVSRILEFTPLYSEDCPADAALEVLLNGISVAKVQRNSETDRLIHLNGKTIANLVTLTDGAYPLTLTLKRIGGMGGSVSFDRISLGGGWQLGKKDQAYQEFMTWSGKKTYNFFRYFLAHRDIKLLSGQMYGKVTSQMQSKLTLCFAVSEALSKKGAFVFRYRTLGYGTVNCYLNGELICSRNVKRFADYEEDIPNGLMTAGVNEFMLEWAEHLTDAGVTSKESTGFDYMRLEPKRFPRGTIYMIR